MRHPLAPPDWWIQATDEERNEMCGINRDQDNMDWEDFERWSET